MHDAFTHLPSLRDRIRPAEQSVLRVTPEVLALWDERAKKLGVPSDWRLSDQTLEDSRRAILGELAGRDLWIYSYGSLMWDPGFHFAEVRLAELAGFQRRFTFRTHLGRGSPGQPALMLSLEPADGFCKGLAFRIEQESAESESAILWRREMVRGAYRPALLPVQTPQGEITALIFGSNPDHHDYVGELTIEETAQMIGTATGLLGTNRAYLEQLADQLEHLEIEDPYLSVLIQHVQSIAAKA